MIVSPNKGVFFVATAMMCSAALYAAEVSSQVEEDPLSRVFVGTPNQLTLPPGFQEATAADIGAAPCELARPTSIGPHHAQSASTSSECETEERPSAATVVLPGAPTEASTEGPSAGARPSLNTAV